MEKSHSVTLSVEGTFSASEAVAHVTSALVGRNWLPTGEEGRQFTGVIYVRATEIVADAEATEAGETVRVRDMSTASDGLRTPA